MVTKKEHNALTRENIIYNIIWLDMLEAETQTVHFGTE